MPPYRSRTSTEDNPMTLLRDFPFRTGRLVLGILMLGTVVFASSAEPAHAADQYWRVFSWSSNYQQCGTTAEGPQYVSHQTCLWFDNDRTHVRTAFLLNNRSGYSQYINSAVLILYSSNINGSRTEQVDTCLPSSIGIKQFRVCFGSWEPVARWTKYMGQGQLRTNNFANPWPWDVTATPR